MAAGRAIRRANKSQRTGSQRVKPQVAGVGNLRSKATHPVASKSGQIKKGVIVHRGVVAPSATTLSSARNSSPKKANVIRLVSPNVASKTSSSSLKKRNDEFLTPQQRENLVLKYRLKARKISRSMLRRWQSRMDLQEVDSVVDLSLCEAVRRFNPNMGAGFMTFMFYHLRGNMIRAVTQAATLNSVPVGDLQGGEDRENGGDDFYHNSALSAHANEIAEALCGEDLPSPEDVLFSKEMNSIGISACERLDPLEREVIERIYLKEQQLMDIASSLGYSRCHISRVKRKALDTLQSDLNDYLEAPEAGTTAELEAEKESHLAAMASEDTKTHYRRRPRTEKGARILGLVSDEQVITEVAA